MTSVPSITGNPLAPTRSEDCCPVLPAICCTCGNVAPGPPFSHVSFIPPHPLSHRCLCCSLQALPLVLKRGKYRACRPIRCSPTGRESWIQTGKKESAGHSWTETQMLYSGNALSQPVTSSLPPNQVATFSRKSIRKLSLHFPLLFVGVVEKDKWPATTMFTWVGFPSHHPSSWQSDVSLITEKNFSRTGQLTWSQKHQPVGLHSLSKAQEAGP